jgi:hypothetical protein
VTSAFLACVIAALLWAADYDACRNNDQRIAAENDEEQQ